MKPTIGVLIKSLRLGKKKTLKQISEKTELSISFL
ncbi:DNA-binding protein, partial [Mesorhizobium sp. M00.F.Ca.ET.186.01.1.1]